MVRLICPRGGPNGDAATFVLRFDCWKRVYNADEYMAAIAAERVVRHFERTGFVEASFLRISAEITVWAGSRSRR
jgi:hypothetical protein